eukprot:90371_1
MSRLKKKENNTNDDETIYHKAVFVDDEEEKEKEITLSRSTSTPSPLKQQKLGDKLYGIISRIYYPQKKAQKIVGMFLIFLASPQNVDQFIKFAKSFNKLPLKQQVSIPQGRPVATNKSGIARRNNVEYKPASG